MNAFSNYITKKSFMHNLNPSLKLISVIFIIIMIFLPIGFFGQLISLCVIIGLWISSRLPWKLMKGILKSIFIMFIILFVINWIAFKDPACVDIDNKNLLFFFGNYGMMGDNIINNVTSQTEDGSLIVNSNFHFVFANLWGGQIHTDTLWSMIPKKCPNVDLQKYSYLSVVASDGKTYYLYYISNWYCLSSQVILNTFYITLKIFLMVTIVTLLVSTTTPVQLTFAIEDVLSPLRYLKIPVNEWSMTISIAIRFVPSLLAESQKILKAQASRGVDFSYGNFRDKIKALVSLVVPMFSVAFHKADDLANAMEARSYNPRYARTRYRSYSIKTKEWFLFSGLSILLGLMIMMTAYKCCLAPFSWIDVITIFG